VELNTMAGNTSILVTGIPNIPNQNLSGNLMDSY
jgi:hypothetical protein